jgi:hypothetical protein
MNKVGMFLLFLPVAVLTSGLFGVLHNQISYSVSNEYFTKFTFIQFHLLDSTIPERIRAAEVGFLASWWMGIPLGLVCGSAGFIQRSARAGLVDPSHCLSHSGDCTRGLGLRVASNRNGQSGQRLLSTVVYPGQYTGTSPFPVRRLYAQRGLYRRSPVHPRSVDFPSHFQNAQLDHDPDGRRAVDSMV